MSTVPVINAQLDTIGGHTDEMAEALTMIANKMGAFETPLTFSAIAYETQIGRIKRYLDAGDPANVNEGGSVSASIGDSTGITAVTVTADTFMGVVYMVGTYEFTFDGAAWLFEGEAVTLSDFGLATTGTAAEGDHIIVHYTATSVTYDVSGIDEEVPVNPTKTHVLSLLRRNVHSLIPFDPPQFLYAVTATDWPSGMPAGTYNIVLDHAAYDGSTTEDTTVQFTTTQTIPVGGGIMHSQIGAYRSTYAKASMLAGKFTTYGTDRVTAIESNLDTTEGSGGTALGTTTAKDPQYKSGDAMNFSQRNMYGAARWKTSFIRQWLNSWDKNFTFVPATIWSRPVASITEGFIHTLEPEVRNVLIKVRKRYALDIADGYGYEDVEDYVTLPTMLDVYGSQNNSIAEGPVTSGGTVTRTVAKSLFKNILTAQADKIKTLSGSARHWWLSSTSPSYANSEWVVVTSGALSDSSASYSYGAVPELHIG